MFKAPEKFRITGAKGNPLYSDETYGNNGFFKVRVGSGGRAFNCIASDGMDWEHVSVSTPTHCPSWAEMAAIKSMFWEPQDLVVQFHPPEFQYVNIHPNCLHLWRKKETNFFCEMPPIECV